MVLEGSTSDSSRDNFSPDQPNSDVDPYASSSYDSPSSSRSSYSPSSNQVSNGKGVSYRIDTTQLPKPFFLFNLSADNDKAMYRTIAENCAHAQNVLSRPLRQEEVDAIGFHFAKSLRIVSYGMPAGALIGSVYAYRGMGEYTFPFWKPKPDSKFNPEVFGPLKGGIARTMWHVLRFNLYGFLGSVAGTLFFSTYATTVSAVGTGTDPRLHDYIEAVKSKASQQRENVQRPVGQRNPIQSQEGMMDRQAQNAARRVGAETTYSRQDVQRKIPSREWDDASPSAGQQFHEEGGSPTDSGLLDDRQTEAKQRRQQADDEKSGDNRANTFEMDKVTRQPANFDQDYDDASPTGGRGVQPSQGGAWDRIRKESSGGYKQSSRASAWPSPGPDAQNRGQQTDVQREQQDGATLGDSFAFSASDEERQLAKTEAQKDFDARVEKERNGGDFSQSGSSASPSSSSGSAWERLRK